MSLSPSSAQPVVSREQQEYMISGPATIAATTTVPSDAVEGKRIADAAKESSNEEGKATSSIDTTGAINSSISTSILNTSNNNLHLANTNDASETIAEAEEGGSAKTIKEQDRFLPIANISRIMKKAIPDNGKMARDAKECVQECASEFISFITSEASDRCHQEKRKTINGEDLLWAMQSLGFDPYIEPLKHYLQQYRENTKGDKMPRRDDENDFKVGVPLGAQIDPDYAQSMQRHINEQQLYQQQLQQQQMHQQQQMQQQHYTSQQ